MQTEFITITEFCIHHRADASFIEALAENGLVTITYIEGERFIPFEELEDVERYTRLHDELNINIEGIDTIRHLLGRIRDMQSEISVLRNRLQRYEP